MRTFSEQYAVSQYGKVNKAVACQHCMSVGTVRTKQVKVKKGISGGKATGAVLTGGVSMLATGLSSKQKAIQFHCDACNLQWIT